MLPAAVQTRHTRLRVPYSSTLCACVRLSSPQNHAAKNMRRDQNSASSTPCCASAAKKAVGCLFIIRAEHTTRTRLHSCLLFLLNGRVSPISAPENPPTGGAYRKAKIRGSLPPVVLDVCTPSPDCDYGRSKNCRPLSASEQHSAKHQKHTAPARTPQYKAVLSAALLSAASCFWLRLCGIPYNKRRIYSNKTPFDDLTPIRSTKAGLEVVA